MWPGWVRKAQGNGERWGYALRFSSLIYFICDFLGKFHLLGPMGTFLKLISLLWGSRERKSSPHIFPEFILSGVWWHDELFCFGYSVLVNCKMFCSSAFVVTFNYIAPRNCRDDVPQHWWLIRHVDLLFCQVFICHTIIINVSLGAQKFFSTRPHRYNRR